MTEMTEGTAGAEEGPANELVLLGWVSDGSMAGASGGGGRGGKAWPCINDSDLLLVLREAARHSCCLFHRVRLLELRVRALALRRQARDRRPPFR